MQTPKGTKELETKLNRHFLACSAFIGTAALMSAQNADASIVYSGVQNIPVPTTNALGGMYIDLTLPGNTFIPTGSGAGAAEGINTLLPGWDLNFYKSSGGNLRWYYPRQKIPGVETNNLTFAVNTGAQTTALTAGMTIDSSSAFGSYQAMQGQFTGKTAYMGVQFHVGPNDNDPDNIRYAWVQVAGGPTLGFPATIIDWAYEDSGAGIVVGAVPEPSTLALGFLSAGALGVAAWRKRKKA